MGKLIEKLQDLHKAAGILTAPTVAKPVPTAPKENVIQYNTYKPPVKTKMTTGLMARSQQGGELSEELMGFCNQALYAKILNVTQASQLLGDVAKANLGFKGFKLNGITDVYMDVNVPGDGFAGTNNWLVLMTASSLKFYYNYGLDNESPLDGKMDIPGTVINSNRYFLTGNLVSKNRREFVVNKSFN